MFWFREGKYALLLYLASEHEDDAALLDLDMSYARQLAVRSIAHCMRLSCVCALQDDKNVAGAKSKAGAASPIIVSHARLAEPTMKRLIWVDLHSLVMHGTA